MNDAIGNVNVVAMFGSAQGTYSGKEKLPAEAHWEIPAAWQAVVRNERVSEWRVYADNEPVWKVMGVKRF